MPSPGVTVNFTLQDDTGTAVQGRVTFTLVNFGGVPPRVSGTSIIANQVITANANASGVGSAVIWGNYQLTASGSYYFVQVFGTDSSGNISAAPNSSANYQFSAGGAFDLSSLVPMTPPIVGAPAASATGFQVGLVVPSGTIDGVNKVFTLPSTPNNSNVFVFLNGVLQQLGLTHDYTISGATITFNTAPPVSSVVLAIY